jgi:hypothetical protein
LIDLFKSNHDLKVARIILIKDQRYATIGPIYSCDWALNVCLGTLFQTVSMFECASNEVRIIISMYVFPIRTDYVGIDSSSKVQSFS